MSAADIDLLSGCDGIDLANSMVAAGIVDSEPTSSAAGTGTAAEFQLATGRAGSKTGRLWIAVEDWHREPIEIRRHDRVALTGRLAFGRNSADTTCFYLDTSSLRRIANDTSQRRRDHQPAQPPPGGPDQAAS